MYLLKAAGLSKSTFHYQCNYKKPRSHEEKALVDKIKAVFEKHHGNYGCRRVYIDLRNKYIKINHKRVQRLMHELGLKGRRPTLKRFSSYKGELDDKVENLADRQFKADKPLHRLGTDVTQIRSHQDGKWLYLSPLIDFYNNEVIHYSISDSPTVNFVVKMFDHPALDKVADGCLCHSDQGFQYKNPAYKRELKARNITQSMSRKGNCLDNARVESFFSTLKNELDERALEKLSYGEAKQAIERYIDYYNNERIRLDIKMSPRQYRLAHQCA